MKSFIRWVTGLNILLFIFLILLIGWQLFKP